MTAGACPRCGSALHLIKVREGNRASWKAACRPCYHGGYLVAKPVLLPWQDWAIMLFSLGVLIWALCG